ncbi:MAG: GNAT family N-acetyltransferase [Psychroflexus sp.]|nr:GNAT family N-acetyltransferase [Psychroflexus sp.]
MKTPQDLKIIPFEEKYAADFKQINEAWLGSLFEITASDKKALNNPVDEIINKEGHIFLAIHKDNILGCFALEKVNQTTYMLSRMGVNADYQGLKIGQKLVDIGIAKARELHAEKLILYTSHQLVKAINLYFKNGFKAVHVGKAPVNRATLKMEKSL